MKYKDIINVATYFDVNDVDNIKNNGVVFTPEYIVDMILYSANIDINDKVCEPSVGKGSFIFPLLKRFIKSGHNINDVVYFVENNLYCYDINKNFINEFKILLTNFFVGLNYKNELNLSNIKNIDYLQTSDKYDVIIGNPPYVKIHNIEKDILKSLRKKYKSLTLGNVDLYYAFVEKALIESYKVNFIIPNTFIKNKSGKILRKLLETRLVSLKDFKTEKIWNNISTYTCIISCDKENDKKWNFSNIIKGENKLKDLINYSGIGLQTSANKIYLIDDYDDKYGYINGFKIEIGICKKIIKATTDKKYDDYRYIIYPYDKDSKPLTEEYISNKYPKCYTYLLSVKSELNKRNLNHDIWYAYGRNQGLLREKIGECIILPLTFLKSRNIHYFKIPQNDDCLILKGIMVDTNNLDEFIKVIQSDDFLNYLEENNKTLPDKQGSDDIWLTITANSIKKYEY